MTTIKYRRNELFVEKVSVNEIVRKVGTPVYIYSRRQLTENFLAYKRAFRTIPHLVCYAVKANPNLAVLKVLVKQGSGADIVSGGELIKALKAKIPASRIVFAGVGKTGEEIAEALRRKILMFNVESQEELLLLNRIASNCHCNAPVSLRVNPDINPKTHPYISTGLKQHKFGVPIDEALEHYRLAMSLSHLTVIGLHMHLGSQITTVSPFRDALKRVLSLVSELSALGINIQLELQQPSPRRRSSCRRYTV